MDTLEMLSKIERLLKERTPRMSKAEFYEACGITASAVSQWRNGKTQPARSTIEKMAGVLGVTTFYLTEDAEYSSYRKYAKIVGRNICNARELLSLSEEELSKRIGVSVGRLRYLEFGLDLPNDEETKNLCDALNVSAEYLGFTEEQMERAFFGDEKTKAPTPEGERITMDDFTYAMQNETKDLTDMDKQILLSMAKQLNDARKQKNGETG